MYRQHARRRQYVYGKDQKGVKVKYKRIAHALLFPPMAIMIILLIVSTCLLVFCMVYVGTRSVSAIVSYVLSAYTLTVWCFRIPHLVRAIRSFKNGNKYALRWRSDARLRVNVSLYGTLIFNTVYGIFQLWLSAYHKTFWVGSLGAYYICLAVMRFFLVRHTRRYTPGEKMRAELVKYRACGWIFLIMSLALSLIVFFMVYWDRTFEHHMITSIAMAAYTFTTLTVAIVNSVKYRKYNSPVFSASKTISLASSLVSMLTLTSTMLTAFNDGTMTPITRKILLSCTGAAVSCAVITMAVYMIVNGTKGLKKHKKEEQNG